MTKKTKEQMKKVYFVSYAYSKGFGQIEILSNDDELTYDVIMEFRKAITKKKPEIKEPIILFIKELVKSK